jgi:hypothetical protein
MKKIIMGACMLLLSIGAASAQTSKDTTKNAASNPDDTTQWKINLLKEPSSPGASLLGISPSAIQKPTDPSAFMVSLLNSTDNLSTIPSSYAVDFAPQWLFWGDKVTYKDFAKSDLWSSVKQTFDVSFAMRNIKDSTTNQVNTRLAAGFKVTLIRGSISDKTTAQLAAVHGYASAYNLIRTQYINKALKQAKASHLSRSERDTLIAKADKAAQADAKAATALDALQKGVKELDFTRTGFTLDLAGGLAYNFINQANGTLYNSGVWLTGGEQWKNGLNLLGIVRYLYDPQNTGTLLSTTNYYTLDYGARILYGPQGGKFSFGLEGIYRDVSGTTALKSSYRYALTTDYRIGTNQVISFNIGRDFDGTVTKGGNLLAAINFLVGFGNNRPTK